MDGSNVPALGEIVDGQGHKWTLASGVVLKDGTAAGYSANVDELLWFNGTIYQRNAASLWWSWTGSGWLSTADPRQPSANLTTSPSAARIVDDARNTWVVVAGVVYENGSPAGYSSGVVELVLDGGVIYQENAASLWWSWNGTTWVSTSAPTGTTTSSTFGVRVAGNRLVSTQTGAPVAIVGANMSGLETGIESRWATFASTSVATWKLIKNLSGSGLNTVRLPLNEASWLNYQCVDPGAGVSGNFYTPVPGSNRYQPDPAGVYRRDVEAAVANITAAGMYVILDLHWGSPNNASGEPLCPIGQPAYADSDHSLAFWTSVADTFKNNPAVMFELFNEPFGSNTYSGWVTGTSGAGPDAIEMRDGGPDSEFLVQNNANGVIERYAFTWNVAGMNAMIAAIRGQGATNVVLSAPIGFAGEIETWLQSRPTDPAGQLAASWHVYGYAKGTGYPSAVLAAGYPIVITETYGLNALGGYAWAYNAGIGILWWYWNDWGGQSLATEMSTTKPWQASTTPTFPL